MSKQEQLKWGKVIETYLHQRQTLKLVIQLVDIRHAPSEGDQSMVEWLRYYQVPMLIVATKSDKIKRSMLEKQRAMLARHLQVENPRDILLYSSQTKDGRDALWQRILQSLT